MPKRLDKACDIYGCINMFIINRLNMILYTPLNYGNPTIFSLGGLFQGYGRSLDKGIFALMDGRCIFPDIPSN